jgi:ATP-binding cassette subfamily F protein uup
VSHDRAFLNEVCTSLLVFEGEGRVVEYFGGYDDWQKEKAAKAAAAALAEERAKREAKDAAEAAAGPAKKVRKLSNKERVELDTLPKVIEKLETEQANLSTKLADPMFFKRSPVEVTHATERLHEIEAELAKAFARWSELE